MAVCTYFGHRDCPASIKPKLRAMVEELIVGYGVDWFYVGRQGAFDAMARAVLRELTEVYPHISYAVVLEWLPRPRDKAIWDFSDTIFPEGLETMPPRFAIARRNKWMLRQADYVVTYITHGWGGAARYVEMARKKHKTIIELPK